MRVTLVLVFFLLTPISQASLTENWRTYEKISKNQTKVTFHYALTSGPFADEETLNEIENKLLDVFKVFNEAQSGLVFSLDVVRNHILNGYKKITVFGLPKDLKGKGRAFSGREGQLCEGANLADIAHELGHGMFLMHEEEGFMFGKYTGDQVKLFQRHFNAISWFATAQTQAQLNNHVLLYASALTLSEKRAKEKLANGEKLSAGYRNTIDPELLKGNEYQALLEFIQANPDQEL